MRQFQGPWDETEKWKDAEILLNPIAAFVYMENAIQWDKFVYTNKFLKKMSESFEQRKWLKLLSDTWLLL